MIWVIVILCIAGSVLAGEPELNFQDIQQQAMGGAGVAVLNPNTAMQRNPAALAYTKTYYALPLSFGAVISTDVVKRFDQFRDMQNHPDDKDLQSDILKDMVPTKVGLLNYLTPLSFISKGFGLSVYARTSVQGRLKRPTSPVMEMIGFADIVPALGYARQFSIRGLTGALGLSVKYIHRIQIYDETNAHTQLIYGQSDLLKYFNDKPDKKEPGILSMNGYGVDIGWISPFKFREWGSGHCGLTIQNIGARISGTRTLLTDTEDVSLALPTTATLGVGFHPSFPETLPVLGWGTMTIALDYKFISPHEAFVKNLYIGIEHSLFNNILKLRGGLHQGFVVGGLGVDIPFGGSYGLHLQYARTAEEMGSQIGYNTFQYHVVEIGFSY